MSGIYRLYLKRQYGFKIPMSKGGHMSAAKKEKKSKIVQNPKILSAEGFKRLKDKELKKRKAQTKENKN